MIENKIIFDDDMSWTDDVSQITQIQEEAKHRNDFLEEGRYAQFLNHGLFSHKHVYKLKESISGGFIIMPVLVASLEELQSQEFLDFSRNLELYCEKLRNYEELKFNLFLFNDTEYSTWDRTCYSLSAYMQLFEKLRERHPARLILQSPRVGQWSCDVNVDYPDTRFTRLAVNMGTFSSLMDCAEFLYENGIKC